MLRDRLVCGVSHDKIQNRLLAERNLTYDKAMELALAQEAADKDTNELRKPKELTDSGRLHFTTSTKKTGFKKKVPTCYRCGGPHFANECQYLDAECNACKKKGHLAKVCRTITGEKPPKQANRSSRKPPRRKFQKKKTYYLEEQAPSLSESDTEGAYSLFSLTSAKNQPICFTVCMNGVQVKMQLDTGASLSVISEGTYSKLRDISGGALQEPNTELRTYTGEVIQLMGKLPVKVRYDNQEADLWVQVAKGDGPDLIGMDWLCELRFTLDNIHMITDQCDEKLQQVLQKHSKVFSSELGCLRGTEIKLHIDPQANPKFHKARAVPYALKGLVEKELEHL